MQALIVLTVGLFLTLSAFVRGSHFVENKLKQESPHEQVALPTATPAPTLKPTPEPEAKHTLGPQVKGVDTYQAPAPTVDPDPIITCPSAECGDRQMKQSECLRSTCCGLGDAWYWYSSKEECTEAQNKFYAVEPTIVSPPPTYTPVPYTPPTYVFPPIPPASFEPLDNQAGETQKEIDQAAEDRQYEDELYKLEYQAIEREFDRKIREAENSFASRGLYSSGIARREIGALEAQKNQELERLKRKYGKE